MPAPHPISKILTFCNGLGESMLVLSTRFVARIPSRMNGTLNYVYGDANISGNLGELIKSVKMTGQFHKVAQT